MNDWTLVYEGFDPENEGLREALCTLGNGHFATRGADAEAYADEVHYPGTYVAGGYNRLVTEMAGRNIENEDLVNFPNWLCLRFRIQGGTWISCRSTAVLSCRKELDIKSGILIRSVRFEDEEGRRIQMAERRIVHMAAPHTAALEMTVTAENWSGTLEIESALDGNVINAGVKRYRQLNSRHLEVLETDSSEEGISYLKVQTVQSEMRVAMAARTRIFKQAAEQHPPREPIGDRGYVGERMAVNLPENGTVRIEKTVSLHTSRDRAISECGMAARDTLARAGGFEQLLESHKLAWKHIWRSADIWMTDRRKNRRDDRPAMILRLYTFHIYQTVSSHTIDLDTGVPARGWHGEAYRGHIFWDELYILPYMNLQYPEITRSLLLYRYRRLDAARQAAKAAGYRGAMFPWQSGSSGREETQQVHLNPRSGRWLPDHSSLQKHVNAAVAFNILKYYESSGDMQFMTAYGAEMILEIARFWSSIATYNESLDRYEIHGVMGPDEYHEAYPDSDTPGVSNNAYTNVMAAWVLCRALDLFETLPRDRVEILCDRLSLGEEEFSLWRDMTRKMRIVFHDGDIISQFEGFEKLEDVDWDKYREKYGNIQRMDRVLEAEGDSPNRYKLTKQADVLMLFYLFSAEELKILFNQLGYTFDSNIIPRNIDYYVNCTSYGSTLSWVVHSWVLTRSDRTRSWNFFLEALESDISDIQGGTTQEGIHLGAMTGSVNILQQAYMGIETREEMLWINPTLPEALEKINMRIRYRGNTIGLEATPQICTVTLESSRENIVRIGVKGSLYDLPIGLSRHFPI